MKKELKKIQLHRNFFRSLIKENEIKDSRKLEQIQDSCYAIEEQMEKVRDLEKDFKSRKLNKQVYLDQNEIESKFIEPSDDSDSDSNQPKQSPSESEKESSENNEEVPLVVPPIIVKQEDDYKPIVEAPIDPVKPLFQGANPFGNGLKSLVKPAPAALAPTKQMFGALPKLPTKQSVSP